ncbi:helix-turn-helix domain-containing protein [Nocardia sp. NPDC049707]|uniref:winged helix-turn-helix domain-containing protein n=1 Tax=Nocardia sp. NPDC049707 TaxID=3154735 RepID=UPI00342986D5
MMHPAFRNGSGLDKSRGQTCLILRNLGRPVTAQEVAEAVDGKRRTVDRHLTVLEKHGLAVKTGVRWEADGDSRRLDELAIELGTIDRAIQQAEQNERNREGFRTALGLAGARQAVAPDDDDSEFEPPVEEHERQQREDEQEMLRQAGLLNHIG